MKTKLKRVKIGLINRDYNDILDITIHGSKGWIIRIYLEEKNRLSLFSERNFFHRRFKTFKNLLFKIDKNYTKKLISTCKPLLITIT